MLKTLISRFASVVAVVAALAGCGDSKPGSTGEFATVEVTATSPGITIRSDVSSATEERATFAVTSTAYTPPPTSTGTIAPSDVQLVEATVTFVPINGSPELPVQYPPVAETIPPTSSPIPVSVALVGPQLKAQVRALQASNPTASFTYYVQVSFRGVERQTDRGEDITATGTTTVSFTGFSAI